MEWVQPYASVDARKRLEQGVTGERYKHVYSVDRALHYSHVNNKQKWAQFIKQKLFIRKLTCGLGITRGLPGAEGINCSMWAEMSK